MSKKWFENFPVILLAGAVAFTFAFSVGTVAENNVSRIIEIKIEDILLVILGLVWLANILISGRRKLEKPPLFFPILAWIIIGILSVLTNWIFRNIGLGRGFFYFLKEIEFFFLYFYLFYHINPVRDSGDKDKRQNKLISNGVKSLDAVKFITKIWIFFGLINVGWVVYQIIGGITKYGYYGPGAIGEGKGSFPSGGFFLLLFIFFFNLFLYYYCKLKISTFKKALLLTFTVSPALGIFSTGSRTAVVGFFFALFLIILLYFLKADKKLKAFFVIIFILIITIVSCIYFYSEMVSAKRAIDFWRSVSWELSEESQVTRFSIWEINTFEFLKKPLFILFGMGKGVLLVYGESHNQFVRNFIETGIIGSLAFFFLIFIILKKSFKGFLLKKNLFAAGLSAGLFVATLTMLVISMTVDAFIVVKVAETYWFFTAITMATLYYVRHSRYNKLQQSTS